MKQPFITLLNEFIETNNKKVLEQPQRFMSLFLDYTQNEYRAETQIFSQFLSSKYAQEIKSNNDVDIPFLKGLSERFYQTYKFDKNICELVVLAYARFLGLIDKRTCEIGFDNGTIKNTNPPQQPVVNQPIRNKQYNAPTVNVIPQVNTTPIMPQNNTPKSVPKNNNKIIIAVVIIFILALSAWMLYETYSSEEAYNSGYVSNGILVINNCPSMAQVSIMGGVTSSYTDDGIPVVGTRFAAIGYLQNERGRSSTFRLTDYESGNAWTGNGTYTVVLTFSWEARTLNVYFSNGSATIDFNSMR
jgi:predicted nucleic acid binding AN1-type Zn finger protein